MKYLIFGSKGQDGRIISGLLRRLGCNTTAVWRGGCSDEAINGPIDILDDYTSLKDALIRRSPDFILYFSAVHGASTENTNYRSDTEFWHVNEIAPLRIARIVSQYLPNTKFFFASSSQVFGRTTGRVSELSCFSPVTPYGVAKARVCDALNELNNGLNSQFYYGVLFNHESRFRSKKFITMNIAHQVAVAAQSNDRRDIVVNVFNQHSRVDWLHASDTMKAILCMIDGPSGGYLVGSGVSRRVADWAAQCFRYFNVNGKVVSRSPDPHSDGIYADTAKLNSLGWVPAVSFEETVADVCRGAL